jgi:leader peptidase (prepilin peptidase)/N-methyltransferase
LFFVLGAISASFIGLIAARLYTSAPLVRGRSHCDACGVTLSPLALIPILSWLISLGRCRTCLVRVSPTSTLAEVMLGTLFALSYLKVGLSPVLPGLLLALVLLTGLVLYDLAHSILPPTLLWLFVACAAYVAVAAAPSVIALALTVCTALLFGSLLATVHLASSGRAMGLADAPLAFGLALLAGSPLALSGLIFSFWIGGVIGIILLARRALGATIESEVPFAPYLAAGFLLAHFTSWDAFALVASLFRAFGA